MAYPLKFKPILQPRIWGGDRLRRILGKPTPNKSDGVRWGESWELADLPPGSVKADSIGADSQGAMSSVVANGKWAGTRLRDILTQHGSAYLPGRTDNHYPLLIKFLDAREDLSVQVHPTAEYTRTHPGTHLKTEAWCVIDAAPGAKIYKGCIPGTTREQFESSVRSGKVADMLQSYPARVGDCHFLPSGTVHALGAGVLVAEVQTPSDTTFRIFDWNRLGPDGQPRTLHLQEALDVVKFDSQSKNPEPVSLRTREYEDLVVRELVSCQFFDLTRIEFAEGSVLLPSALLDSQAQVWVILSGQAVLHWAGQGGVALAPGDTVLLPAAQQNQQSSYMRVVSPCAVLAARLPNNSASHEAK